MPTRKLFLIAVAAIVPAAIALAAAGAFAAGAPPQPTFTQTPPSLSSSKTATFAFRTDSRFTLRCSLDGATYAACTSPYTTAALVDGKHTFSVVSVDGAQTSNPRSYTWTIDTTPPTASIGSGPAALTNSRSAQFSFSSNETGSNFQCQLDAAAFATCSTPQSYSNLSEGAHTFKVRAIDSAGNTGTAASSSWTVDTTPPTASIGSSPAALTNSRSADLAFSSTDARASFACALDGSAFAACSTPQHYAGLADGPHSFQVRATDAAGNTGAIASSSWTVDSTAPLAAINSDPASLTADRTATFTFSSNEDASFACALDGGGFAPCGSPQTYTDLADGPHSFKVEAIDRAGNSSSIASYAWKIDTVAPITTIDSHPALLTNSASGRFEFSASKDGSTFECDLDGVASACVTPQDYGPLLDGSHTFTVRATDPVGNTGETATYTWTIDTVAPTATIDEAPTLVTTSPVARFSFSAAEDGSSFACALDGGAFAACAPPQDYSGLADGIHSFQVKGVDLAGNTGAAASYTWTIAPIAAVEAHDSTPPGAVGTLHARAGYGAAVLSWQKPADPDFDHVTVSRATAGGGWASMYTGDATTYDDKTVNNGIDQRYSVVTYDHAGNASRAVFASVPASALLLSPKQGARLRLSPKRLAGATSQPVLAWTKIRGARFYNVQLYKGNRKILSLWPRQSSVRLPVRWTYAKQWYALNKGSYRWFVWPAVGRRYGALEGQSSFRVG